VIHGELASGGMATVHLGQLLGPAGFARTVAIKRLHDHLASDPEFVAMLLDEAKLVASIHHPNVVSTVDVVCENDDLLIVMDYVEGENLATLLREARPPSASVVSRIVLDALAGLHAAHTAKTHNGHPLNIVHRDVSPQNIIVGVDGVARVLDFGVAKGERRRHSTRPGRIKGKFAYMSPEQIRGARVDARTDVFATGIVLWECLTGQRLFGHGDKEKSIERVLSMVVPPPSRYVPTLSPDVDCVVLRALARDPGSRYASAADFARELHAALPPACPVDVSAWVKAVAKGSHGGHARLFRQLETSTISQRASGAAAWLRDALSVSSAPRKTRFPIDAATVASGPPVSESTSSVAKARSPRAIWFGVGAAALCSLVAFRIATTRGRPPENVVATVTAPAVATSPPAVAPPQTTTVAEPPPPPTNVAVAPPPVDSPPVGVRASSSDPTPPEAVESLPAGQLPLEATVSSATPAPRAPRVQAPAKSAARGERRPAAATPASSDATRAASAPSAAASGGATGGATGGAAAGGAAAGGAAASARPVASCDPPYRIDALGIRRVRRECL
jgi:eukaryotic-like serine/threonine-protein kinase